MTSVPPALDPNAPVAYRIVTLTKDGHVVASLPLAAHSDDEALSLTASMVRDADLELWDGLRFMAHFEPESVLTTGD